MLRHRLHCAGSAGDGRFAICRSDFTFKKSFFEVTAQLPYSFPCRGKVGMGARAMLALAPTLTLPRKGREQDENDLSSYFLNAK